MCKSARAGSTGVTRRRISLLITPRESRRTGGREAGCRLHPVGGRPRWEPCASLGPGPLAPQAGPRRLSRARSGRGWGGCLLGLALISAEPGPRHRRRCLRGTGPQVGFFEGKMFGRGKGANSLAEWEVAFKRAGEALNLNKSLWKKVFYLFFSLLITCSRKKYSYQTLNVVDLRSGFAVRKGTLTYLYNIFLYFLRITMTISPFVIKEDSFHNICGIVFWLEKKFIFSVKHWENKE